MIHESLCPAWIQFLKKCSVLDDAKSATAATAVIWLCFFLTWGEATWIICYSSGLISIFLNPFLDFYVLPERASILAWPWSSSFTAPVSHDRCFSWPPDIFLGSHGPLSGLVNFALSTPRLLAYECPHSHTYSMAVRGAFKKWFFLGGNLKRPEGT